MQKRNRINRMIQASVFCAVICVLSLVVVPIGPVPFSLSVLAVALAGSMLPPAWAMGSVAAYLLLGFFGLPVFAGFAAGPGVLFGPTGGYLMGYFALALSASLAAKKPLPLRFACTAAGLAACYALGTVWFVLITQTSFIQALWLCVIPFILPDIAKIVVATLAAQTVQKRLQAKPEGGAR